MTRENIEKKKAYLRECVLHERTGIYGGLVVFTYYFIYKLCKENGSDWCYAKDVTDKRLSLYAYNKAANGRYDHDSIGIVKKVKELLIDMGYIDYVQTEYCYIIKLVKPLDFLPCDIEKYVENEENRFNALNKFDTETLLDYLNENGINIYKYTKNCWKCNKQIDIYTYFLDRQVQSVLNNKIKLIYKPLHKNIDHSNHFEALQERKYFSQIGLGLIDKLDEFLSNKIKTVKYKFSKSMNREYFMNTCHNCGQVQGINFVVFHNKELEYLNDSELDKLIAFKVFPKDINLGVEDLSRFVI